jgi:BASS family bile acid:Na+ symporter
MQKVLLFLTQKFSLVLIATLLIGITFQDIAALANPCIKPLLMFGIYLSLLKIDFSILKSEIKNPLLQLYILLFTNFILPITLFLIMKAACYLFTINAHWAIAVLVLFGSPTASMVPSICILMKGHVERAIISMLLSSLAVPFSLPIIIRLMNGNSVEFDTLKMIYDLCFMIATPILFTLLSKFLFKEFCKKTTPYIPALSVIILAIIVLGCVDGLTKVILNDPTQLITGVVIACSMALCAFTLGWLFPFRGSIQDRTTIAIFACWPNVGLVIVISNLYFKVDYPIILLFAIIYEIPWNTAFVPAQKFIQWKHNQFLKNQKKETNV